MQDAKKRLAVIVPLSLILIVALLYSLFNSVLDSFIALSGIPFAVCGGVLGLYVAGLNLSVSAAVGFISIFGVAVMDGILLSFYIRRLWQEGHPFREAIVMGCLLGLVEAVRHIEAESRRRASASTGARTG